MFFVFQEQSQLIQMCAPDALLGRKPHIKGKLAQTGIVSRAFVCQFSASDWWSRRLCSDGQIFFLNVSRFSSLSSLSSSFNWKNDFSFYLLLKRKVECSYIFTVNSHEKLLKGSLKLSIPGYNTITASRR